MNFLKKNLSTIILAAFLILAPVFFLSPLVLLAQGDVPAPDCVPGSGRICNPIKTNNINDLIKTLLEGVLKIGMPIVALAVVYCGFLFVSARGNPEKLTKAKSALLYTLIGAAILLGSWAIAKLISDTVLAL